MLKEVSNTLILKLMNLEHYRLTPTLNTGILTNFSVLESLLVKHIDETCITSRVIFLEPKCVVALPRINCRYVHLSYK